MKKLNSFKPHHLEFVAHTDARAAFMALNKKSSKFDIRRFQKEMQKLHLKFPEEKVIEIHALALYGDYSQILSSSEEKKIKKSVSVKLEKFLEWSRRQPIEVRRLVYNEYFYHSGNYLKQYQLGLKYLRLGYNGHFSAGVGSSCYALELFKQGNLSLAKIYAKKSLKHWSYYKKDALQIGGMFYVMALFGRTKVRHQSREAEPRNWSKREFSPDT